jgi:hypothetical protein
MATALRQNVATLDKAFCQAVASLPQVTRVVAVHVGAEPSYVVTVGGNWVEKAPAVHSAVRPLRRRRDLAFRYRTIREDWAEPDPTPSIALYSRT